MCETEFPRERVRPIIRWKDSVKKYMHKRVGDRVRWIELARRECVDRERWRLFCHDTIPLGYVPVRNEALDYRLIDRTFI